MTLVILGCLLFVASFIYAFRVFWKDLRGGVWPTVKAIGFMVRASSLVKLGTAVVRAAWQNKSPWNATKSWARQAMRACGGYMEAGHAATESSAKLSKDCYRSFGCFFAAIGAFVMWYLLK